jgi:N-acetylmuramoyl-L-alanine amidase
MTIISHPSPNHDSREGVPTDMLILHYTGMKSGAEALARLCDAAAKVSAHYLVEENGDVYQLVDESERAWHAGVASWRGHSNINARSIGIEIVNFGHEWGYKPFPKAQMDAVAALCQHILARHDIPARNVIGHSDVAPARKQDPGELFDWAWLAGQGVGVFPTVCCSRSEPSNGSTAFAGSWQLAKANLAAFGYTAEDVSDEQLITAFQRHFRPDKLTGIWDAECEARLNALLDAV